MPQTSAPTRYLADQQIAAYRRDGYLAVPGLIGPDRLADLRRATDEFVERSRRVDRSDDVFDLDPRHRAEAPVLRRIKNPADNHPLYRWVAFESPIADVVAELIGPDVRFHHSKLNLKGSHIGAPVEWHQDAAFYPHSNDDVLAVGLLLDDATPENGCLQVIPRTHGKELHHFGQELQIEIDGELQAQTCYVPLQAGDTLLFHSLLLHASEPNTSAHDRRVVIFSYKTPGLKYIGKGTTPRDTIVVHDVRPAGYV